ncbi:MAG: hypothetical protein QOI10_403 [Solirubrobacterales bacterium]|nr:hypothetical protein [Solirubrobacterales bacterium]
MLAAGLTQSAYAAGNWRLIAYANDSGVHNASSGFDTGVGRPRRLELRVQVDPDEQIRLDYQVGCSGHGEARVINEKITTPSARIPLPLGIDHPRSCTVYAFATYHNPDVDIPVSFRVELRAQRRPGSASG